MRPKSSAAADEKVLAYNNYPEIHKGSEVKDGEAKLTSPNQGSKKYSISEMFEVLNTMKENRALISSETSEPYKNSAPTDILHGALLSDPGTFESPYLANLNLNEKQEDQPSVNNPGWENVEPETPSPLVNSNSLLNRLASLGSGHNSSPPPGLYSVPPEHINWYYLDPLNQEQGPFVGTLMHTWYSQGYLNHELKIRRAEETSYYLLSSFIARVQNSYSPFLVSLPTPGFTSNVDHLSSFFGNQQAHNNDTLIRSNFFSAAGHSSESNVLNASFQGGSSWRTPVSNLAQPSWNGNYIGSLSNQGLGSISNSQDFGIAENGPSRLNNQSPFYSNASLSGGNSITNLQSSASVSKQATGISGEGSDSLRGSSLSPGVEHNRALAESGLKSSTINDDITAFVLGSVLNDVDYEKEVPVEKEAPTFLSQTVQNQGGKSQNPEPVSPQEVKPEQQVKEKKVKSSKPKVPKEQVPRQHKVREVITKEMFAEDPVVQQPILETVSREPVIEKLVPVVTVKSKLAPWAKAKEEPKFEKQLTLAEIQEIEAARKEKELKELEIQRAAQRNLLFSQTLKDQAAEITEKKLLPGTAGWGKAPAESIIPTRTLLDIQKEEAALKKSTAPVAKGPSFASALLEPTSSNDNSWTVVANVSKKAAPAAKSSARVAPGSVKASSVAHTKPASSVAAPVQTSTSIVTPGPVNVASKQRREFLAWCRTELKELNRGVDKEELLRMFFMFPGGNESKDLIQDTIYSSSKTINGRRFAEEFIKRRRVAEKTTVNWEEALSQDPFDTDDDEWTTTISKKKGRR